MQAHGPPALGRVFPPLQCSAGLLGWLCRASGLAPSSSGHHFPWGLRLGGHECLALVVGGLSWEVFAWKQSAWDLHEVLSWGCCWWSSVPRRWEAPGGPRPTPPEFPGTKTKTTMDVCYRAVLEAESSTSRLQQLPLKPPGEDPSFSCPSSLSWPPLFLGSGHLIPTSALLCVSIRTLVAGFRAPLIQHG